MEPTTLWRDAHGDTLSDVPDELRRWLLLGTSMTVELRRWFRSEIGVRLLLQCRGALLPDESALLGTGAQLGEVREVALQLGPLSLLAARTVHVSPQLGRRICSLGSRPLGALLFGAGKPQPDVRQFALLPPGSVPAQLAQRAAGRAIDACWARRSLFRMDGQRLLVTEIFLPAMLARILPGAPEGFAEGDD